jgi:hypothetical protein
MSLVVRVYALLSSYVCVCVCVCVCVYAIIYLRLCVCVLLYVSFVLHGVCVLLSFIDS